MLRLRSVGARYGAAAVVQQVDLEVGAGETVALLGPNGAGKSTLLAAITGTIRRREFALDAWWPLIGDQVELRIDLTAVKE